jgi:Na+/H+ antiporter NhaD/arsenite permease-like protein
LAITVTVFVIVYIGMILGTLPGLKVNRAAIALLGATALLATGEINEQDAVASVGYGTIGLLFGLMIVAANFDLAGLYDLLAARVGALAIGPRLFLAVVVALCGVTSALLTNDVIAVALAPVILNLCIVRRLNPVPYLLGLACSTNAGSIATIIGSPQNMLIGQHFHLSFVSFMAYTAVPAITALAVVWGVIAWQYRDTWRLSADLGSKHGKRARHAKERPFDRWEAIKGLVVVAALVGIFVLTDWPRGQVALAAGGIVLANAHFKSRKMLHRVDWELLVLFIGLFIVNGALHRTGLPQVWIDQLRAHGFALESPAVLFLVTAVFSDVVSNVPSVMLLLPFAGDAFSGPIMAVASGLSSNLIVIGSLASIIVVDAAGERGLRISFWDFARTGIPVTLLSMLLAAGWLWLMRP